MNKTTKKKGKKGGTKGSTQKVNKTTKKKGKKVDSKKRGARAYQPPQGEGLRGGGAVVSLLVL